MNKEQIIDEAYENYLNYPLATIHDHHTNILYQNRHNGWCMLNGRSMASPHPTRHLTQEEFIDRCKTNPEFSEKWGLKIEERELSLEERQGILEKVFPMYYMDQQFGGEDIFTRNNIPNKLITITYNNEKIESYE